MTETFTQIILGFIQGVAEWLPISSSGHLAIASIVYDIHQSLAYDVFLHLASLIVLLIYFRQDIASIIVSIKSKEKSEAYRMIPFIILTTAITVVVAFLLKPLVEHVRESFGGLSVAFLVTSIVVALTFKKSKERQLTWRDAVLLGFMQGFAVIPGISRSGMMIGTALLLGIKRKTAFIYAFLAAIPVIIAASISEVSSFIFQPSYLIGFVVVLVVGYASLWLLDKVVRKGTFHLFSIYTIVVALILILYA